MNYVRGLEADSYWFKQRASASQVPLSLQHAEKHSLKPGLEITNVSIESPDLEHHSLSFKIWICNYLVHQAYA